MKHQHPEVRSLFIIALRALALPVGVTGLLWFTSRNNVSLIQLLLALALLLIPWMSYLRKRARENFHLPVFAIISFMYWVYYAPALFWADLRLPVGQSPMGTDLPPEMITAALVMCFIGVCFLWLGTRIRIGSALSPSRLPDLMLDNSRRNYLRALLIFSALLSVWEISPYVLGEGGRQMVILFMTFVPLLAFAILFRLYLRGQASRFDKFLVFGFLITRLIVGLSSGWLGSAASIIIVCGATFLAERRRIPRIPVIAVILLTLFFQVGKEEFRQAYWTDQTQASQLSRVSFWVNASLEKWTDASLDPSGDSPRELLSQSVSRVSLLTQSANVIDQTPAVVPYQNGRLYKYFLITYIPRFVWPDKPSASEPNRFYQIAYGVTAEEDIGKVAIGVGVLTEAFINFGWIGVVGIMFLLGIFFDYYQNTLLGKSSGILMSSLGISLLPQMLGLESQMVTYLAGIVQQVGFAVLVFSPVIRWRGSQPRREFQLLGPDVAQSVRT